jgi:thiol:disulfide interchange protein DsbC
MLRNPTSTALPALFLALLLFCGAQPAAATQDNKAVPTDPAVAQALQKFFPQVAGQARAIRPTPVPGLYEVAAGPNLLYFFPATGHILAGQLMDSQGRNLTRESMGQEMTQKIDTLPLDQAIKIGTGKHRVIEFTDPDCPYCRKGSAFFAERKDVTRYIFLFPLAMHPKADPKARYILSSANPAKAYEEVMTGHFDQKPLPEFKDNGKLDLHLQLAKDLGIRSTPTFWVNGEFIGGANFDTIRELLGDPPPVQKPASPPADAAKPK